MKFDYELLEGKNKKEILGFIEERVDLALRSFGISTNKSLQEKVRFYLTEIDNSYGLFDYLISAMVNMQGCDIELKEVSSKDVRECPEFIMNFDEELKSIRFDKHISKEALTVGTLNYFERSFMNNVNTRKLVRM